MSKKLDKIPLDFIVITLLIVIQVLFVVFNVSSVLRAGLGFLFVAFIPGYILQTLLLDSGRVVYISIRRLVLAVPISLSIAVLIGLAGYLIDPKSVMSIVQVLMFCVFDFVILGLAVIRRRKAKLRGTSNFLVFIFILYILVTLFVVIYPAYQ